MERRLGKERLEIEKKLEGSFFGRETRKLVFEFWGVGRVWELFVYW